ncbi:hypothetical protein MNBD_ACTINO02-163 [hydrothermal vent metagenome]|uniref:Uncharacterized protein n=1 Tax=hydrothermal vent metagenome TaxID=652676 RepID=A0A3B0T880_9ZZZZ
MRNDNDRIFDLLSGTLTSEEETRLRDDIAADPELAEELRLQTEALTWLEQTDTPHLSEFESAKLRAAVRAAASPAAVTSSTPERSAWSSSRLTWVFATAAVILAFVGAVSVLPRLVGSESADSVALTETTSAPAGQIAESAPTADQADSFTEMADATTTTAAASTMAPNPSATRAGDENGEFSEDGEFSMGDLTASEYLAMVGSSTKRGTLDISYATESELLQICLETLTADGLTSFQAEVSTYSGDVLFAERYDENGNIVEVVKILIDGCVEIDRAP